MQYRIEIGDDESVLVEVPDHVILHEDEVEKAVDAAQRKRLPETRAQGVADALGATLVGATAAPSGILASDIISIPRDEYEALLQK